MLSKCCSRLKQLLVVLGKVEGGDGFLLWLLAIVGSKDFAEEQGGGHAVEDDVVDIHEQPDGSRALDDFDAVEVVVEQIERTDKLLEVAGVGLAGQNNIFDDGFRLVASLLSGLAVDHGKARLHIGMGVDDAAYGSGETRGVLVRELVGAGDVILQGVAVHFPVDVDTLLVF